MPSDALCSKRGSGLPIVWRHSDVAATQQNPTAICESVKNIIGYSVIDRLMCARIIASECQSTESNGTFLAKWHTIQPSTKRARATLSRCLFIYLVFAIVIVTKKVVTLILDTTIVHHVCATVDFSSQIPSECVWTWARALESVIKITISNWLFERTQIFIVQPFTVLCANWWRYCNCVCGSVAACKQFCRFWGPAR